MGHGGQGRLGTVARGPAIKMAQQPPHDPYSFPGYTHLFDAPERERSAIGADIAEAHKVFGALFLLLPNDTQENPNIPAGYTYLLQFVAHDLVDTTVPFWLASGAGIESRNMRHDGLQMDALYGGGPTVCPVAFKPTGREVDDRTALRLGQISDAKQMAKSDGVCPYRDLARANLYRPAADLDAMVNFSDPSHVYIADPRNDDNINVAQLTVLFSILHNAIASRTDDTQPEARFAHARTAMSRMYYAILRKDLLPRLLHEAVCSQLRQRTANGAEWLWHGKDMPLEFSHGAFRVGHAMVRDLYRINDRRQPLNVSELVNGLMYGGNRQALSSDWIIEWARLFEIDGTPLKSLRLKPRKSSLDLVDLFERRITDETDVITLRDWLSSATAGLLRVDRMADRINQIFGTRNIADPSRVKQWLETLIQNGGSHPDAQALIRDRIDELACDLPLPLYVLLEASLDPACDGLRMGVVGSAILGEVLFRRILQGEAALQGQVDSARDALGGAWDDIEAVQDMPALIRLAATWGGLAECPALPFIGTAMT
jgi:Animal haem peroxidase